VIERPSGIRACVFDAYGTLFDVRNVAVGVMERTGVDSKAFFDIWRAKQLEYSWLRAVTGHHVDFCKSRGMHLITPWKALAFLIPHWDRQ